MRTTVLTAPALQATPDPSPERPAVALDHYGRNLSARSGKGMRSPMVEGVAFVDGKYIPADEAKLGVFDLGFTRGDAVYDTTSVWKGNFFRLDDHVARFLRSAAGMRLS